MNAQECAAAWPQAGTAAQITVCIITIIVVIATRLAGYGLIDTITAATSAIAMAARPALQPAAARQM